MPFRAEVFETSVYTVPPTRPEAPQGVYPLNITSRILGRLVGHCLPESEEPA